MDLLSVTRILAYVLNIVILFLFLRWLLYKPVTKFLKQREERFAQRRQQAEDLEESAQELQAQYEQKMNELQSQSARIIQDSRQQATRRAEEILDNAEKQARMLLDNARTRAFEERRAIEEAVKEQIAQLAVEIAAQILARQVTVQDNRDIIDRFLQQERIDQP